MASTPLGASLRGKRAPMPCPYTLFPTEAAAWRIYTQANKQTKREVFGTSADEELRRMEIEPAKKEEFFNRVVLLTNRRIVSEANALATHQALDAMDETDAHTIRQVQAIMRDHGVRRFNDEQGGVYGSLNRDLKDKLEGHLGDRAGEFYNLHQEIYPDVRDSLAEMLNQIAREKGIMHQPEGKPVKRAHREEQRTD